MRKFISSVLLLSLFLTACSPLSPEKYFDVAVLNTNFLTGFANNGQVRELESPSATMSANGEPVTMKRKEVIESKIDFAENTLQKLTGLGETADNKEIIRFSIALYQYVLPVYKKEYVDLAKLYDSGASKEEIQQHAQMIHDKYYQAYDELYTKLINSGKLYAEKHQIKVNWRM